MGTVDTYDWIQIAAAINHPEHARKIDISQDVRTETGVPDASVVLYAHNGYGNPDVLREVLSYEKPDVIVFITDPRFWGWLFLMEHEIRSEWKIPMVYVNIWDSYVTPLWNASAYASCDMLFSINKGTKVVNSECLRWHGTEYTDLDKVEDEQELKGVLLKYLPHGSTVKYFFKEEEKSPDWNEYVQFRDNFLKANNIDFCVFYNSRNIRRKQPGDVILAYKLFCDKLTKEQAKRCCLLMKTHMRDDNGTDLMAVKKAICPKYRVMFNEEQLPTNVLNWFYNLSDVTIFMSSAEGFGLAANESLLTGTPVIAPVTGGLQDQMRFQDETGKWIEFDADFSNNSRGQYKEHGSWAFPVFPRARQLQGSVLTPYLFDDVCDAEDAAARILEVYNLSKEERERRGLEGRNWALGDESGMNSVKMSKDFKDGLETVLKHFKPKPKFEIVKTTSPIEMGDMGITLW